MPRFSIIVPDYEGSISRDVFRRCIGSVQAQTFDDYEVLAYHDGPKKTAYEDDFADLDLDDRYRFTVTETRYNDWGHSLRDRGLHEAEGDYIVHLNGDNVLYAHALESIDEKIRESQPDLVETGRVWNNPDIILFPVVMKGMAMFGVAFQRLDEHAEKFDIVMSGLPPRYGKIDAMQLVMRRDLWLKEGGWTDKRKAGDSFMYRRFVAKYGMRYLSRILGEHW